MGPIARDEPREAVVDRLIALLEQGAERGCELVVFPELALTTFFPRWYVEDPAEFDEFYEREMPGGAATRLFDVAADLGVGFCLGYAEIEIDAEGTEHRRNTYLLVERDGSIVGKYHKVHVPGHEGNEPWRAFQHVERRYFEPGTEFGVWRAFRGVVGMAICNDRRWSETYRVMGLQGAELILIGYNTPLHYAPDPTQNALAGFHNHLVMQAGAYQNGSYVVGVAKGGTEEGVESLAQSVIIAPSGQLIAQATTIGDELISARIDFDLCATYQETLFDFDLYRVPEAYELIARQRGRVPPPDVS